jgi:hypothetical protein
MKQKKRSILVLFLHIVKDENELIFVRHVGVESTTKD